MLRRKLILVSLLATAGLFVAACAVSPGSPATTPTNTAKPVEQAATAIAPPAVPTTESGTEPTPVVATSGSPSTPITVQLILSKPPRLNETADVTLVVSAVADAPGTTAEIILPAGAVPTSGDLIWSGDIDAGGQHTLRATFAFQQEGDFTIQGKALRPVGNGDVWGDLAAIYLNVTMEAGKLGFSNEPPAPHSGVQGTPPAADPQGTFTP